MRDALIRIAAYLLGAGITFWFLFRPRKLYHVVYPDGQKSMGMSRHAAKSYAKIFGGRVSSEKGRA